MVLWYDAVPGLPATHLLTLEVNEDRLEVGQKVLQIWAPIVIESPPGGIVPPHDSEENT